MAVQWEYLGKNPITKNACPKRVDQEVIIWEPQRAIEALSKCKQLFLLVAMHLAISGSMREGEICGLTWPHISFGEIDNGFKNAALEIVTQLQRISKKSYDELDAKKKDIHFIFPPANKIRRTPRRCLF